MREGYKLTEHGEIPETWNIVKIKDIGNVVTGNTPPPVEQKYYTNNGILWASPADLGKSKYVTNTAKQLSDVGFRQTRKLLPKSILVTCIGSTIGKIGMSKTVMATNQQINSIICNEFNEPEYFFYAIQSIAPFIKSLAGTHAVPLLNKSDFSDISLVRPPLPEQKKIAEILSTVDDKTEVINDQITQTRELKKALMQSLLTKGIGHTKFKDSPLGKIPENWEVIKLKDIGKILIGLTYSPNDVVKEGGTLVLRSSNIKGNQIVYTDNVFVKKNIPEHLMTKDGDILICARNGSKSLIGKNAIVDSSSVNHSFGAFMSVFRTGDPEYVFQLFQTESYNLQIESNLGATINQITTGNLGLFKFPYPPLAERNKIAKILSTIDEKLKILQAKKYAYIELKKGLMQQLLTGKIRVKAEDIEFA